MIPCIVRYQVLTTYYFTKHIYPWKVYNNISYLTL